MVTASPLKRLGFVAEVAGIVLGFAPLPARLIPVRYSTCQVAVRDIES